MATDKTLFYGIQNRHVDYPNNSFEEFTYSNFPERDVYNSNQQFATWEGLRHRQDSIEYFKSTQNDQFWRCESEDELENRIISPGYKNFYQQITPERLARDPGNAIHNYYNGWLKNTSDGAVSINSMRSQLRAERKGNYWRVRDQVNRTMMLTKEGYNGPVYR